MQMRQVMLFIIYGGKMPTTDGRRQSFPPALLPLLMLVLLSGCPPPCKGDLRNTAEPAPAPSLGFETVGNPPFHIMC